MPPLSSSILTKQKHKECEQHRCYEQTNGYRSIAFEQLFKFKFGNYCYICIFEIKVATSLISFELNWKTIDNRSGPDEMLEAAGKTARLASVDYVAAAVAVEPRFQHTFQVPIDVAIGHIPKICENTRAGNNVDI